MGAHTNIPISSEFFAAHGKSSEHALNCLHRRKPFVTYLAQASVFLLFALDLFAVVLSHLLMAVFLMS